jgi:hypothetical protein
MIETLKNKDDDTQKKEIREEIKQMALSHPIPESFF